MSSGARPSLQLLAGSAISAVLGYCYWLVLARTAPVDVVGASGAAVSLLTIVGLLSAAGLAPTVLASVSASTTRGTAAAGQAVRVAMAVATILGATIASLLVVTDSLSLGTLGVLALSISGGLGAAHAVLDAVAIGTGHASIVLVRTVVLGVVRLAILLLVDIGSVDGALLLWCTSAVAGTGASYLMLNRRHIHLGYQSIRTSGLLGRIGWNQFATIGAQAPGYVLPLIVTVLLTPTATAGYYLAWQIAGGCFIVAAATAPTLLARAASGNRVDIDHHVRAARRLTALLLVPAVAGVSIIGPVVLELLGNAYSDARWVLWIFAAAALPDAYTSLEVARLRAVQAERHAAGINLAMGGGTLLGAAFGISVFGTLGAAAAFGISQSCGVLYCVLRRRHLHTRHTPLQQTVETHVAAP